MAAPLRTIDGLDVRGKRVLVRIDADVDLNDDGKIEPGGDHRLRGCRETLEELRARGARLILLAHLGRPDGQVVERLRLTQVGERLSRILSVPVRSLSVTVGPDARDAVFALQDGELLLLENVRFDPREEQNDPVFAFELAALGELYVNDAFAVAHRAHASVAAITTFLPSYAGRLLAREVRALERALKHPDRPVVAAISGAKITTKVDLLQNLLPRVDSLLTGGGVANMFLQAQGRTIGASLVEEEMRDAVGRLWHTFQEHILVPTDARVARGGTMDTPLVVPLDAIGAHDTIYDIGPETAQRYCAVVAQARTVIWNGPLGKVEYRGFQEGTRAFATCVQASSAYSIIGGGDTVTALTQMELKDGFDHVSSGGGAMIAFLEGAVLPGLEPLRA